MIPYVASGDDEPLQIIPWPNHGVIAVNFLALFYELVVGAQGDGPLRQRSLLGASGGHRDRFRAHLADETAR
ncbi:MAG: hypothetical protein ACXWQR_01520 [Ktedonobacterales bacterium]